MKPAGTGERTAFWTMTVAAGVIAVTLSLTAVAFFDMATEGGGAADLNGAHQTELIPRQGMELPVSRPVLPKNVSQFEHWPRHLLRLLSGAAWFPWRRCWCWRRRCQCVKRSGGLSESGGSHGCVPCCGVDPAMAHQRLDDANILTVFQQVRGEAVPHHVRTDAFADTGLVCGIAAGLLDACRSQMRAGAPGRK